MQQLLKSKGYKITPARLAILETIRKAGSPQSAEDLSKKLRNIDPVTVYRNLAILTKSGLLRQVDLRKDSLYFELADSHHHHIVCTSCEKIEDFENKEIENMLNKIMKKSEKFIKITDHSLELFGVCKKCS